MRMDPVKEIKEKLDIVELVRSYMPLQPAGKNLKGLCPFHKEKTPSFIVSPDRQTWHCFGQCNEGGDIFSFVMKYENVEFYEALRMLAEKAGIELKRISPASQKEFGVLYDIHTAAKDFFEQSLREHENARAYLSSRNISDQTIEEFSIGFSPPEQDALSMHLVNMGYEVQDIERAGLVFKTERGLFIDRFRGRILFPIYNTFGKVVAFSGRILPEFDKQNAGKYINSPETLIYNKSKILYGFHVSKTAIKEVDEAIVVEGQMDLIAAYQDGVHHVVATSGTALTTHHLEILKKFSENVTFAFDNDEAGMSATQRAIDMAHEQDMTARVFMLTQAKDVAEYVQSHPGTLGSLIKEEKMGALDFYAKIYLSDVTPETLKEGMRKMLSKVLLIQSPLEKSQWVKALSERFGVLETALYEEMQMLERKQAPSKPRKEEGTEYAQTAPVFTPSNRLERLAEQICTMAFSIKTPAPHLASYQSYFPESFLSLVDAIISGSRDTLSPEDKKRIEYMEAHASLQQAQQDEQSTSLELSFLLKELKKEFLKQKREYLGRTIAQLEREGKHDQIASVLKEFDELARLIDNS